MAMLAALPVAGRLSSAVAQHHHQHAAPSSLRSRTPATTMSQRWGSACCHAEPPQQGSTPPPPPGASTETAEEKYQREFRSLGSQVIEQSEAFENPPDEDMWEGEKFENLGKGLEKYFIPSLVVLGVICGGIAAATYNSGADTFIRAAPGPEEEMQVIPADKLLTPEQEQQQRLGQLQQRQG